MGNDPVNLTDPSGGSILGAIGNFFKNLFGGGGGSHAIAGAVCTSCGTASSASGSSLGGSLANGAGNAAAGIAGQWVANKLFPLPSGPNAGALQQIADIRQRNEAIPSYLQNSVAGGGDPVGALQTWRTTQQIAGWVIVIGGGPENPVADALATGVEIVGGAIALYQLVAGGASVTIPVTVPNIKPLDLSVMNKSLMRMRASELEKSIEDTKVDIQRQQKAYDAHEEKAKQYRKDPDKYDDEGRLQNVSDKVRQLRIDGRLRFLEKTMRNIQNQIDKLAKDLAEKQKILNNVKSKM